MSTENNEINGINYSSFATKEEELAVIKDIEEQLGTELPNARGWKIAIALYVRPEKITASGIILADSIRSDDKYKNCCGRVVALGELAYKDAKKFPNGPWCKLGDYVGFPRHAGHLVKYSGKTKDRENILKDKPDGIPLMYIPDDSVFCVASDPAEIELY